MLVPRHFYIIAFCVRGNSGLARSVIPGASKPLWAVVK